MEEGDLLAHVTQLLCGSTQVRTTFVFFLQWLLF